MKGGDKMSRLYDMEYYRQKVRELKDMQICLYIEEFSKLRESDDVIRSILWNDLDKILCLMYEECYRRIRMRVDAQSEDYFPGET